MLLLTNGRVFINGIFDKKPILICHGKILNFQNVTESCRKELHIEVVDCSDKYIIPGLIDPHLHLAGGSGEQGGFASQSNRILVSECIEGGITTAVGTIGVDTTTITMRALMASVKALNESGISAYAYTGGYDMPPKTLLNSVRDDIVFVSEIIGVGEIAIADRRAAEPSVQELAKVCVDAYVAGMLTAKCGITHVHVGSGRKRLETLNLLLNDYEIIPQQLYLTHLERSEPLIQDGIQLAKHGCFIDFDVSRLDLEKSFLIFKNSDGPKSQLSFSSDAGIGSPKDLWQEIRKCVLNFNFTLEELLPHVTSVPARVLKLKDKGQLVPGCAADLVFIDQKDLEIVHVMSCGKWLMQNKKMQFPDRPFRNRRRIDLYEIS